MGQWLSRSRHFVIEDRPATPELQPEQEGIRPAMPELELSEEERAAAQAEVGSSRTC